MAPQDDSEAVGASVTFEVHHQGRFLLVRRPHDDSHWPGYWAFPGGRVQKRESLVAAAFRECEEEVGCSLTGRLSFVDSYEIGKDRFGVHLMLQADDDAIKSSEFEEYRWVDSVAQMREVEPRIPGIDNHALMSMEMLRCASRIREALIRLDEWQRSSGLDENRKDLDVSELLQDLNSLTWTHRNNADLTADKYTNR